MLTTDKPCTDLLCYRLDEHTVIAADVVDVEYLLHSCIYLLVDCILFVVVAYRYFDILSIFACQ